MISKSLKLITLLTLLVTLLITINHAAATTQPLAANQEPALAEVSESPRRSSVITDDGDLFAEAADNALGAQNVEYVGHIGGSTEAIFVQGNYAYIGEGPRLTILDITNPASPTVMGNTAPMPGLVQDIYVSGNYAYLAGYSGGLRVINISNPGCPTEVGFYDSPGSALDVYLSGNHAYLADLSGGLFILQFTGEEPTPTPTNTPTPSNTPTPTATPTPALDAYEPDDSCPEASTMITNGTVQEHTFHAPGDEDWVGFQGIAGTTYLIEALTPAESLANVVLELYGNCGTLPTDGQDHTFSPDVRLQFEAPSSGSYHLKLTNDDLDAAGPLMSYHLSVRALSDSDEGTTGALILVAGRLGSNDSLQDNIHHVTNAVYELFLANGYTGEDIYYLATEDIDVDNDGSNDVDASPNRDNLNLAITQWAAERVGANRALTIYIIDHASVDLFHLNGRSQTLTPNQLNGWLDELEAAAPEVRVNVIVEACHAGSFIELGQSISQDGRVVITSTGTHPLAYASDDGAVFSDAFVDALKRGMSLSSTVPLRMLVRSRWPLTQTKPRG
jgi:hypothetical protein